jgi:hypothetical protein
MDANEEAEWIEAKEEEAAAALALEEKRASKGNVEKSEEGTPRAGLFPLLISHLDV